MRLVPSAESERLATRGGSRLVDVTAVVPTRDRRELLVTTLRSLCVQQAVDFEVIVVDDGSAEDVQALVARLGDPRVRVVHNDVSQGVGSARNRGLAEARGSWVAFCDDDDLWAPDKLIQQLRCARATGRAWVYTGAVNITLGHRVVGGAPPPEPDELLRELPAVNAVPGGASGVMASKVLLEEAGGFDEALQPLADWDLWLRLSRLAAPACVPEPLVAYRLHTGQMSQNAARVEREFAVLRERSPAANAAVLQRYLGWWCLRAGHISLALRHFLAGALERDPRYPVATARDDVLYLARQATEQGRRRYASRLIRRSFAPAVRVEHTEWRARAQAWVDALFAPDGSDDPQEP